MYVRPTFAGADALPIRLSVVVDPEPGAPEDRPRSVADLVAAAAVDAPGAPALIDGCRRMTYGELMWRADRLGEYLRRLGVGPMVPVGLCLCRSFDRVVAMLAVWRAGAGFLSLDPAWPTERLAALLDEAQVKLVIAESGPAAALSGPRVALVLDRIGEAVAKCEPRRDPAPVDAKALAYLMPDQHLATRRVTHGELVDWVMRRRQARGPGAHLRAFHAAAPCSDAGVTELWPPLAAGALVTLTEASREPTTAVERRLAEIVAHVLDLDRCDLDQDLVPLWEDEALTAKAVLMIRAGLGVEPTAHDLAGAPTLADLAGGIEARLNTAEVDGVLRA